MNYTPLNINNKNILKSNWFVKQKIDSSLVFNSPIKLENLKPFVPDHFEIDFFQGIPMMSLVVNFNDSLSFKYLPFLKHKKSTHVQFQTYVKRNGVSGIFLLSFDTNHPSINAILKPLTDFPLFDSNIEVTENSGGKQIDLHRAGLKFYVNTAKPEQRVLADQSSLLKWIQNRFHIFNIQKSQVVDWKLDNSPIQVSEAKIKNIQFDHSVMGSELANFNESCFVFGSHTLRIWPPNLSSY